MRATFSAFETVKRALVASQMELEVTSQNVSNVNTEGYTRQRLDISSISAQTGTTRFAPTRGSAVGQGVDVVGVTQIRDQFLDLRYRKEITEYGKWSAQTAVITDVENVLDEASTDGLLTRLADLYTQLESFSLNAESVEYASIFRSSAQKVVEVLNHYASQLDDLKSEYTYNAGIEINEANNAIQKISELNKQIKSEYMQGSAPNELIDMRNLLLDDLSGLLGVSYETMQDGQVSITLNGEYLLDSEKNNKIEVLCLDDSGYPVGITYEDGAAAEIVKGSIGGYMASINGKGCFAAVGEDGSLGISYFQESIDVFAQTFADTFNQINDATGVEQLFVASDGGSIITGSNISISSDWMADARFITTSTVAGGEGSNDNLLLMIEQMDKKQTIGSNFEGTFEEYVSSLIGEMAVQSSYVQDMKTTSESVLNVISDERESIMGVSLDEEAINLEKYQKSYNVAARVMTTLDEMIDRIINSMGIVGR